MKVTERKAMIDRAHVLPVVKKCNLVEVSRSSIYYHPSLVSDADCVLMRLIDKIHSFSGEDQINRWIDRNYQNRCLKDRCIRSPLRKIQPFR